jgi:hypothetical protein
MLICSGGIPKELKDRDVNFRYGFSTAQLQYTKLLDCIISGEIKLKDLTPNNVWNKLQEIESSQKQNKTSIEQKGKENE